MSSPTFASPELRSFLFPLVLAVFALAIAGALAIHFFPATTVKAASVKTDLLPTTTVYKAQSIVVGQNEIAEALFVAATIRVDNAMRVPIYVDGISLTLTDATGAALTQTALSRQDIASVEESFPKVKPLVSSTLLQDVSIDPGKSAQGIGLFSLSVPKTLWDGRTSAVVKVNLYHQPSVFVTIPKS